MRKAYKYIQIIGTQRSGSNLLRVMLNQLPEVVAPHPPHILQNFLPIIDKYGDLEIDNNFMQLIEDVCRFVELNPVPWTGCNLNRADIFSGSKQRSIYDIFRLIYEAYANSKNGSIWCCKSMTNINYVNELEESKLDPFYIFLFRDGRDVALSFKKAIVGEKHIYHLAKKWKNDQELSLNFLNSIDDSRKYMLSYEELILSPEKYLKQICNKLNIDFNPKMLAYYDSDESRNTATSGEMWKNVQKPIIKSNRRKYRKELSVEDIKIFESVAKDTLRKLGYLPDYYKNGHHLEIKQKQIALYSLENENLKLEARKKANSADLEKRKPQTSFLYEVMTK
ncbi:MAG: sulfotransferase [Bacteroidota bacterium]